MRLYIQVTRRVLAQMVGRLRVPVAVLVVGLLAAASPASAASPTPGWEIRSAAAPTNFSASDGCTGLSGQYPKCDFYEVTATSAGQYSIGCRQSEFEAEIAANHERYEHNEPQHQILCPSDSPETPSPVVIEDEVPAGLKVEKVEFFTPQRESNYGLALCHTTPIGTETNVKCRYEDNFGPSRTGEVFRVRIFVAVEETLTAGSLTNSASVSGGGAATVETSPGASTNHVASSTPPFGFEGFSYTAAAADGAADRQAAGHPNALITTIALNTRLQVNPESAGREALSVEDPRDFVVNLPVGFVGSILAAPQCTFSELSSQNNGAGCPPASVIGHIVTLPAHLTTIDSNIYNMTPERGVAAEFAYIDLTGTPHVFYAQVVPTLSGYVIQVRNNELPQVTLRQIEVVFYGDPAAEDNSGNPAIPFFTNPSGCSIAEEPTATIYMDSWQHPAKFNPDGTPVNLNEPQWAKAEEKWPQMTGCDTLQFPAEIEAQPTSKEADAPSGMNFNIRLAQPEVMGGTATPTLKKVVETFPPGFTVDPSAGDGLQACSEAQIGWVGPGPLSFDAASPACPEGSKIGTLELETPLIGERKLQGEMFLARQYENPYPEPGHPTGSLIGLYVVVRDPITGVLTKIAGKATLNPNDGQITGEFDENPNLPFSDLELHFFGGPRAEFATPEQCGTFTTTTELFPYSYPDSGVAANPFNSFNIDEACPNGSFSPSFTAGSQNLQAGAFTPFVASFQRSDQDQELAGLTVTLPPGLSAKVAGVPQCSDAAIKEAEAGTGGCPEDTQIGTVEAGVGPGPDPFFATGKAYWTGPYNGGPFGLAVVVPAVAGPFDFGTVVVRQSIHIDPTTAQVTDVSDPFPTIIDGIPLRMRRVDVEFNRPGFTFNPTNCSKLGFNGTISGFPLGAPTTVNAHNVGYATQAGASSSFSTPFQVTNCATLGFKPKFEVSTSGKTSRHNGASLHVKLSYPNAPQGTQANIKSVHVELPKALPSRLSTLNHACLDSVFNRNPADCPSESRVGFAKAVTPVLPVPLEGPAYFVSHGGQKFPELILVLQGDGVTVHLQGETFISKAGITSSTFKTVPDVPVGSFDLTLPEGPFSALAANTDLCRANLVMPNVFDAQNGAQIKQNTPIEVEGCPNALRIVHRSVKKRTLTLKLSVPVAGRLVASGKGVSKAAKTAKGRSTLTLTLKEGHAGKLRTKVVLRFTPKDASGKQRGKGAKVLRKSITVTFR